MNESLVTKSESFDNRLERQRKVLTELLDFRIEVDLINDYSQSLEHLTDEIVTTVNNIRNLYSECHPEITNFQQLEDRALEELGFGDVPRVLDKIIEIREILSSKIPGIIETHIPGVITPPDINVAIQKGSGDGFENREELIPRLKMLLFILLNDCHIEMTNIDIRRGSVNDSMMRKEPYVSVFIPDLNRLVIICDEVGNRTDVFDTSLPEYEALGQKGVEQLSKKEKDVYGGKNRGAHTSLFFSRNWSDRLYTVLIEDITNVNGEEVIGRPNILDSLSSIEDSNFYKDEHGESWGSLTAIGTYITGAHGLERNDQFKKLLEQLESRTISTPKPVKVYSLAEVVSKMQADPELSAWYRKVDETGFWTDDNETKWGTLPTICDSIDPEGSLKGDPIFRAAVFSSDFSVRRIMNTRPYDGYRVNDIMSLIEKHPIYSAYLRRTKKGQYWKDENGELWSTPFTIASDISGVALSNNEKYQSLIKTLPSLTILNKRIFKAYRISDVRKALAEEPELSAQLRKTNESGLWTDSQTGDIWGTMRSLAIKLTGTEALYKKDKYRSIFKNISSQKLISGTINADGYKLSDVEALVKNDPELRKFLP